MAAGADFIGIIQYSRAARFADARTTKAIAAVAHQAGIPAAGVFVDSSAEEISQRALQCDLDLVQLHGDPARQALIDLPKELQVIYVAQAAIDGSLQTPLPTQSENPRLANARFAVASCLFCRNDSGRSQPSQSSAISADPVLLAGK